MFLIVNGNALDGLSFFGPFNDAEEACNWAERNCYEWAIAELQSI